MNLCFFFLQREGPTCMQSRKLGRWRAVSGSNGTDRQAWRGNGPTDDSACTATSTARFKLYGPDTVDI